MKFSLTAAAAAVLCMSTAASAAGPEFKFSGFGTVAAVHADSENADFVGTIFQPNGAGHTRSWSFNPDSKLGVQGTATFTPTLSAVVQVVSQHRYDNSWKPQVEWANVKWQATSELSLRLGRIALPSSLLAESRLVGYSYTWARPPVEVYSLQSITNNDGVDLTWRKNFGAANNSLQLYYGTSESKLSSAEFESDPAWGIVDVVEIGSLTLRVGYTSTNINLKSAQLQGLVNGLNQFANGAAAVPAPAYQAVAEQARALATKYQLNDMELKTVALGASYDPGDWFVTSEFVNFKGDGLLGDSRSWYVSGGYRFGAFTPYATYGSTKAAYDNEPAIDTSATPPLAAGAAGLVGGINTTLRNTTPTQNTTSIGLRWDFMKNVALKTQYDRVKLEDGSNGRLRVIPGRTPERSVDVFTVSADFVF